MNHAEQTVFPFVSLDFAGRASVLLGEIAEKLSCSVDHLLNEVEAGAFPGAIDIKGTTATRRSVRVPIEAYRAYVLKRMTGEFRADFIRDLPLSTRQALFVELAASLFDASSDPKFRAALRTLQQSL